MEEINETTPLGMSFSHVNYEEYFKKEDKKYWEWVVEKIIISEHTDDPNEIEYINSLPNKDKRKAMISLLDKDHDMWSIIIEMMDGDVEFKGEEHSRRLIGLLREYVKVAEVDKRTFGEIMTPFELVRDMLSTLPRSVWRNPHLKWLDPANGVGPFPIMIIWKLMKELRKWEPNQEKRYKHIIENMIYVCELQPKNMIQYISAIDPQDKYTQNVYCGSFTDDGFDYHKKNVWNLDEFDIITGNPPYNTGTSGGNGARDLWNKFVNISVDNIKKGGYLVFVHPSKWRSPEYKCLELFKQYNLISLEIHSKQDGKKLFGAVTRYDFYCLQKSKYSGLTKIVDEIGEVHNLNIMDWVWIPNYNFKLISKILAKDNEVKLDVIYSRGKYGNDKKWMSIEKTDKNNLPCVYGMYKDGSCSYRYSSDDNGHFGIGKVILGLGEKIYPKIDLLGDFGIMNNAFALPISTLEEGENIKKAIESEKFKEIIKSTKWSNFQVNWKMFKSFKKDFWKNFI